VRRFNAMRIPLAVLLALGLGVAAGCGAEEVPPNLLAGWGPGPGECGEYSVTAAMVNSAKDESRVVQVKIDGKVVDTVTLDNKVLSYVKTFQTTNTSVKVDVGEIIAYNESDHHKPIVQPAINSPLSITVTPCPKPKSSKKSKK
jgi:hypothetical protein